MQLTNIKGFKGLKTFIIAAILLILILAFVLNLLSTNKKAEFSDEDIQKNIAAVEKMQQGEIPDIEKKIDKLEEQYKKATEGTDEDDDSGRTKYRKRMASSIILGDSITEGFNTYDWLAEGQVFSRVGGNVIADVDMFETAAAIFPKCAFFAYGMNDMGNFNGKADLFIKQYKSLLLDFRKESPDTKMYICSIAPPSKQAMNDNHMLRNYKKFNKAIKAMCKDLNVKYIDTTGIFKEHPDYYEGDGIHAVSEYYPYWLDLMIEAAGL